MALTEDKYVELLELAQEPEKDREAVINEVAVALNKPPEWLKNIIDFESMGGKTQIANPRSSAKGLIQFTDRTAQNLGYGSSHELVTKNPTFEAQMWNAVQPYLARFNPKTEEDFYLSVFYPAAIGSNLDVELPAHVQESNPGIKTPRDYVNKVKGTKETISLPTISDDKYNDFLKMLGKPEVEEPELVSGTKTEQAELLPKPPEEYKVPSFSERLKPEEITPPLLPPEQQIPTAIEEGAQLALERAEPLPEPPVIEAEPDTRHPIEKINDAIDFVLKPAVETGKAIIAPVAGLATFLGTLHGQAGRDLTAPEQVEARGKIFEEEKVESEFWDWVNDHPDEVEIAALAGMILYGVAPKEIAKVKPSQIIQGIKDFPLKAKTAIQVEGSKIADVFSQKQLRTLSKVERAAVLARAKWLDRMAASPELNLPKPPLDPKLEKLIFEEEKVGAALLKKPVIPAGRKLKFGLDKLFEKAPTPTPTPEAPAGTTLPAPRAEMPVAKFEITEQGIPKLQSVAEKIVEKQLAEGGITPAPKVPTPKKPHKPEPMEAPSVSELLQGIKPIPTNEDIIKITETSKMGDEGLQNAVVEINKFLPVEEKLSVETAPETLKTEIATKLESLEKKVEKPERIEPTAEEEKPSPVREKPAPLEVAKEEKGLPTPEEIEIKQPSPQPKIPITEQKGIFEKPPVKKRVGGVPKKGEFDLKELYKKEIPEEEITAFKQKRPDPKLASEKGSTSLLSPKKDSGKVSKALKSTLKEWVVSGGNLPKEAFEADIERKGWYGRKILEIEKIVNEFDKVTEKTFGKRDLTDEETFILNSVLAGEVDVNKLPPELKNSIKEMRAYVDNLSTQLQETGATTDDLNMIIERNKGIYITRTFRKYTEPNWAKKVPQEVKNTAQAYLQNEIERNNEEILAQIGGLENRKYEMDRELGIDKDIQFQLKSIDDRIAELKERIYEAGEESVKALVESILYTDESLSKIITEGIPLGRKKVDILKRRKNIAKEIRALLGEVKDVRANFVNTSMKIANLISNQNFLNKVVQEGEGKFLFKKPKGEYIAQLGSKESKTYDPLAGYYTTPEIKKALYEDSIKNQPAWLKVWMRGILATKYSKTILYPQTHAKNLLSNTGFAAINGLYKIVPEMKNILTTIVKDKKAFFELIKTLTELGVMGESVRANELYQVFKEAQIGGADYLIGKRWQRKLKKLVRTPEKLYALEDDIWKMLAFQAEKSDYKKAFPEMSEEELNKKVAEIVRLTWPTWSMTPKAIQSMIRFPIAGTFISFQYQTLRTMVNTLRLANEERKDERTKNIGLRRIGGAITYAALLGSAAMTARIIHGITPEEDKNVRKFAPPWDKNGLLIYTGKEGNEYSYLNASHYIPHQAVADAAISILKGEKWQDKLLNAVGESFEPFISEDIFTQKVLELWANKKKTGGKIYIEGSGVATIAKDVTLHFADALEPGIVTSAGRVIKGAKGEETFYKKYKLKEELPAALTGFRGGSIDVEKSLLSKVFKFKRDRIEIAKDRKKLGIDKAKRLELKLYNKLSEDIEAALYLGVTRESIAATLKEYKISTPEIMALLNKTYNTRVNMKYDRLRPL